jgi:Fe-S cluster biogenesis protein NfuA
VRLPLASALFNLGTVDAVYIADDYVSVSTNEWADWDEIEGVVRRGISMLDVQEASRLAREASAAAEAAKADRPANEQLDKANAIIDRFVRPALAADGGGLQILDLDGHTLKVRYQGACGSCPSATMTTLKAIERLLRDQMDPEIVVEAH